jgi:hypothetical protein
MASNGPSGLFFASPTPARKRGKQGGSGRKRKVAGSRPPPTWVAYGRSPSAATKGDSGRRRASPDPGASPSMLPRVLPWLPSRNGY